MKSITITFGAKHLKLLDALAYQLGKSHQDVLALAIEEAAAARKIGADLHASEMEGPQRPPRS
jgi:hypothetical protein